MNTSTNSSQPGGASAPSTPASSPSPSSTPASAPSSAPGGSQTTSPGAASSSPSGADTSFDFLDGIFDGSGNPAPTLTPAPSEASAPTGTQPQTPPVTPASPQVPPAEPPQPAPTTPQASGTPGTEPGAQPAPPAAQQSPQFDPGDPIGLARGLAEHEAEAIEHMAKTSLALSPQELEALEANPGEAIPRLLAKTAVKMQQMMLNLLGQAVPRMLETRTQAVSKNEEAMGKFFKAWPSLNPEKHKALVHELGIRYRKMFPQATLDQMIEQLGPMVLTAAKLPVTAMNQAVAHQPQPAAPQPPKPTGFVPAAPGTVVQTTPVPDDTFGYLGQ